MQFAKYRQRLLFGTPIPACFEDHFCCSVSVGIFGDPDHALECGSESLSLMFQGSFDMG